MCAPRRPLRPPLPLLWLLPLLGGVLTACGGEQEPRWVHLARSAAPADAAPRRVELGAVGGQPVVYERDARGGWLETTIPRAAWSPRDNGAWTARLVLNGRGAPADGEAFELSAGGLRYRPSTRGAVTAGNFPFDHFLVTSEGGGRARSSWVILRLAPGQEPAAATRVRVHASARDPQDPARVNGQRVSGEGLFVTPGLPVERVVDVPEGATLRFATTFEPALALPPDGEGGGRPRVRFRVLLDDEQVFEHVHRRPQQGQLVDHAVPLPARRGARLRFEVEGVFGYSAFLAPVIGPSAIGSYGKRPWGATRPDVVLFLADTFRADNMRTYGSELPLTPFLDELAGRSLVCREAWSVATYTMPAHAAMFSGLYARQTGATTTLNALPEEIFTLAERFAERGYRTGAVTDAVVVSQENNLDQGFERFDELHGKIEDTIERVASFLEADDGRPIFLFVQSYRAHTPYVVSEGTRQRLGGLLELDQSFQMLSAELQLLARELGIEGDLTNLRKTTKDFYVKIYEERAATPTQVERYEETVRRLEALYRAGSADLDQGVRSIHAGLSARGILDQGWFVFTSDHGEAFNEHDKVFHGGKVWGETTRIPLFLHGPGLEPGVVAAPVSLVDLPPTLAQIAGLSDEGFLGSSILTLDRARPIFSFENQAHEGSTFAVIEDGRKVMGYESPERRARRELFAVFDLPADPLEERDLVADPPAWAREMLERLGPAIDELSTPRYGSEAAPVDPARQAALEALGYGDNGEGE